MITLLELAPEILFQVIATLPVQSLLKFSQCSRYTHSLANASLHTLKLDFGPAPNAFRLGSFSTARLLIQVPDANRYDFATLVNLQSALLPSILTRYQEGLQHLDVSLWTLTVPMAKAISELPALRSLSITLVEDLHIRRLSRKYADQQRDAWQMLAQQAVWRGRLQSLKIENTDLSMTHLSPLLSSNYSCRELRIRRCESLGEDFWTFLQQGWNGSATLEILELADCGCVVTEAALDAMAGMRNLKYLDLHRCSVSYAETVEQWQGRMGHVAKVKPPKSYSYLDAGILEVDPDYTSDKEE
ncbi:hypothetical protein FB567DRAFT_450503 [Paraphoma chrysanthemicola]|uniref:F-box domain-containing protein n=1 Tax=Paraphoma chrysanthemicola TaxID=798071 RepID=A0A8K0R0E8_9PLEO|nr:hypothetical protein FB567DRAFT_450503 [Paraphoma chrysanthemicola]